MTMIGLAKLAVAGAVAVALVGATLVYFGPQYGIYPLGCEVEDPTQVTARHLGTAAFGTNASITVANGSPCPLVGPATLRLVARDGTALPDGAKIEKTVAVSAGGRASLALQWPAVAPHYGKVYENRSVEVHVTLGPLDSVIPVNYSGAADPTSSLLLENDRPLPGEDVRLSSRKAMPYEWTGNFTLLVHRCERANACVYSEATLVYFSQYIPVDNVEWRDFTAIWDQTKTDGSPVEPGVYHLFVVVDWRPGGEERERKSTIVFGMLAS